MSKRLNWLWRNFSVLMVLLIALTPLAVQPTNVLAQAGVSPDEQLPKGARPAHSMEETLAKLDPTLQAWVKSPRSLPVMQADKAAQPQDTVLVNMIAFIPFPRVLDKMKGYFEKGILDGYVDFDSKDTAVQVLTGKITLHNLLKLTQLGEVQNIYAAVPVQAEYEDYPIEDNSVRKGPSDWAELRANADKLRDGSLPWDQAVATGDRAVAQDKANKDWFDMDPTGAIKAQTAWDRGYEGQGVKVAVIDDGVDFAHPDLMGKQEIYAYGNATDGTDWMNGWPYIMDPFTMRAYYYEVRYGGSYDNIRNGFEGVTYMDTSTTAHPGPCGPGKRCFEYTPLIDYGVLGTKHQYTIASTMSKSGAVHVGTHHDTSLRDYVWGERVAILVTDPNTAGVYDTVYVDLDNDYDFRDEKPLTKAVVGNPATYNNMIAYRDMNGDGKADLSGGALYFIADGTHFPPGMDYMFRTAALGLTPPAAGSLVAIHGPWISGYSHGTQCASNVVGSGEIDGMLPEFSDLAPYPGTPAGAVYGAAPEAGLVAMNTAYGYSGNITYRDAYYLAAYGWDGRNGTGAALAPYVAGTDGDPIQITSNSYGFSGTFNDGWDMESFVIDDIIRRRAPSLQFLFSTGNGGAGYGTAAPPSPSLGIGIGASTEFGSTGWDSITSTQQINFNDIIWFSNAGPGALGGSGAEVLAGGAYAAGAEELNYFTMEAWGVLDGNRSWASWGGTSRSSPTAMGVLALIYQAYKAKHGVFPTAAQAKAIFMGSATDVNNDVFRQGGGAANADVGTSAAAGLGNLYTDDDSNEWSPGDFRGSDYPEFAHVVYPSTNWNKIFTLINDTPAAINTSIATTYLELMDAQEFTFDVTPAMMAGETADNFYKAFHYFIPLSGFGVDDKVTIPAGTDLMVVRQILPFDEFDANGDYGWDNRYYLTLYDWDDVNLDGNVWEDKDLNGVVNFVDDPSTFGLQADGAVELDWDNPITELDRWEFARYAYNRTYANSYEQSIQDPLNRMHDGIFIGLRHLYNSNVAGITHHLSYRVEFYQKADVPWMTTDVTNLNVPAGGTATFQGTINVPADMPPGTYAAAIEVSDPGGGLYSANTLVIPVTMNVAKQFSGADTLGGEVSAAYDANTTYNNGMVRGFFDWGWREESGDWRNFYMDIDNDPVATVLLEEDFDSGIPGTWTVGMDSGTGTWEAGVVCDTLKPGSYGNLTGGTGEYATANSDCHAADVFDTYLQSPSFSLAGANLPQLTFRSAFYVWDTDLAEVQVSTDGGTNWDTPPLLSWTTSHGGPSSVTLGLGDYVGQADVRLRFRYSTQGNTWQFFWQIDDVEVTDNVYPYDPTAHVLLRDVWDGPAPHNDIDTIVFGPATHPVSYYTFGGWATNGYSSGTYGPYALNSKVASSNDNRAGRSIWRFDTTSGANEEWLAWTMGNGGLHEILQHNVLFEGDQFGVVFTKTVGLLTEDVHSFEIDTVDDEGVLGDVNLESTLPLNGIVASGFLTTDEFETWTNEPIAFTGPETEEWYYEFTLQDGYSIDLLASSSTIPDIDLFLYYYDVNQGAYTLWAYSAGATADEHVLVNNPPDGDWMVTVDNFSGPAGTFNLTKTAKIKTGGISATVTPSGPLAANTPVNVHFTYDAPLALGENVGLLYIGLPEAPQLKVIPFTINRLLGLYIPLLYVPVP
ncbi:MAG: S8 family serine peptidase [Chloroflexota bacterium]